MQVCSCWFSGWCTCRRLLSHLPPAYLYMRPPAWGCFHNPLVITLYINIILINLFTLACTWFKVCFSFLFCQCIKLYRILSLLEWSLVIRHFFSNSSAGSHVASVRVTAPPSRVVPASVKRFRLLGSTVLRRYHAMKRSVSQCDASLSKPSLLFIFARSAKFSSFSDQRNLLHLLFSFAPP